MTSPSSANGRPGAAPARRSRRSRRDRGTSAPPSSPDLAQVARDAVIGFLSDQAEARTEPGLGQGAVTEGADVDLLSAATAQVGQDEPASASAPEVVVPAVRETAAQSVTLRAAAVSMATLDRIEAAAARLEADIAAARKEQAELQARAGAAAEEAVRAAQEAWASAGAAQEASQEAKSSLRLIGSYAIVIGILAAIQLLILLLFASSTR